MRHTADSLWRQLTIITALTLEPTAEMPVCSTIVKYSYLGKCTYACFTVFKYIIMSINNLQT
jgi:hypothetical protein